MAGLEELSWEAAALADTVDDARIEVFEVSGRTERAELWHTLSVSHGRILEIGAKAPEALDPWWGSEPRVYRVLQRLYEVLEDVDRSAGDGVPRDTTLWPALEARAGAELDRMAAPEFELSELRPLRVRLSDVVSGLA